MDVEYRILGPLEVRRNGELVDLGGAKQRTLLVALLLRANQTVATDQLIDELWDSAPPKGARDTVHAYVRRLRRTLRGASADQRLLHGDAYGYRLSVQPDQLDLHQFDALVARAKQSLLDGSPLDARSRLSEALELWRGRPLADVSSHALRETVAARLAENQLAAIEDRIEADLALDRHAELIGELEELVRTYPTRERFCGQLMLALYRAGRQVDALEVYRRTQRLLAEEYGCDPGAELRQLEQAVLANDSGLAPPAKEHASPEPKRSTPCQLPPDIPDFTGRAEVMTRLRTLLGAQLPATTAVPVVAVSGQAGSGKSTLAIHLSHCLTDRYPDGQLYANLRGVESDPAEVLAQFLRALGVEDGCIPGSREERGQLFRTLLAGRRMLVVLDNAADEAQVRPLLPGDAECGAIITSRRFLAGLEAVHAEDLPVFSEAEALRLLRRVVGAERLDRECSAAREVAALCDFLPLAVRIAGARLAAKPHWPLHRLVAKLRDEHRRMDELRIGDLDVRANLSLSYDGLSSSDQAALRCLSAWRGPDFPSWVAARMLDIPVVAAEDLLERLVDDQLLGIADGGDAGPTRYRWRGLVRDFAAQRRLGVDRQEPAGVFRVVRGYLDLATRASNSLRGSVVSLARPSSVDAESERRVIADPAGWFSAEEHCLTSAMDQAREWEFPDLIWRFSVAAFDFLLLRGRWDEIERTHLLALEAVRGIAERAGEARLLTNLAVAFDSQHRNVEAVRCYTAALRLYRALGDRENEADLAIRIGRFDTVRVRPTAAGEGHALVV